MKKFAVLVLTLASLTTFGIGSAFAETPLSQAVNSVIGAPYKYAGTTPKGFDCSGYTSYIFSKYFDISLPHQSKGQSKEGTWVDQKDLRPGDLVFFNTDGKDISHVGIYVGNGEFYHSATDQGITVTKLSDKYYKARYVTARRVLSDEQYDKLMTDPAQQ